MELLGDHSVQFRKFRVRVKGMMPDLRFRDAVNQNLVLRLDSHSDRDLFAGLCLSLVSALEQVTDSESALAIAMMHIQRWKSFLSGSRQRMSPESVRGLFGELLFLNELLDHERLSGTALDAWAGPECAQHDFSYEDTAVEIKTITGVGRCHVRISSGDQLESLKTRLFLRIYRLSEKSDSLHARSLNALVETVRTRLVDADARDFLDQKLSKYGYAPLLEYDEPSFLVSSERTYRVQDGFPRIVRSELMAGLDNVSYDIRLEAIASFECDGSILHGEN